MIAVVKSAGATVANRGLQLVVQTPSGVLRDLSSASFQIFEQTRPETQATPAQVFPATGGDRQAISMTTHRIGLGRYAAVWAPAAESPVGQYFVRWFYQETASGPELSFDQEFELISRPYIGPAYCTLYDLAAEGMTAAAADDGTVQRLIVQASRYIEHYTKRQFFPLYKSLTLSGRRGRMILLDEPIVAIESLNIDYSGTFAADQNREIGSFRVFNRHLTQNLVTPDDRDNPKLEFLAGWGVDGYDQDPGFYTDRFSGGTQNVRVAGIFGYTEHDGSHVGATPQLIRHACKLLCFKQRYGPGNPQRAVEQREASIKSEYTRDQGYILFDPRHQPTPGTGVTHTADPEIDAILAGFVRGPAFGAA